MPLRIRVPSSHRDDLLRFLRGLGADARKERGAIKVLRTHPVVPGEPAHQDRIELEFIVSAWARRHPGMDFEIEDAA
jgi:hypothetical protein